MIYSYLEKLNNQQKQIVINSAKQLLITAGAGSGKTKILIKRFLWLYLEKKYPLDSFIIITFAHKAATEIKLRIKKYINNYLNIYIGTFHSVAYRIIKNYYLINKLNFPFKILNNISQLNLIQKIIHNNTSHLSIINNLNLQNYINSIKELGYQYVLLNNPYHKYFYNYYLEYQKICKKLNYLDFSEIILTANTLLNNYKIKKIYQTKFLNILIDEFQDINNLQYIFFKNNFSHNNVFIVGDDDQSIYGWRGGNNNNFNRVKLDLPYIKLFKLEQNFRSSFSIIECANNLIKYNTNRVDKLLWTKNNDKTKILVYKAINEIDEGIFICKTIKQNLLNNIYNIKTIGILFRNNFQITIIKQLLKKYKINNLLTTSKVNQHFINKNLLINYLYFFIDHNNDEALLKIINIPLKILNKKLLININLLKKNNLLSIWKIINNLKIYNNNFSILELSKINLFLLFINKLIIHLKTLTLPKKIYYLLKQINNFNNTFLIKYKKQIKIFMNNVNLYYIKNKYLLNIQSKQFYDIDCFIKSYLLYHNINISLMTIHTAKGLEFDQVFVIGLENGLFPLYKSIKQINLLEEERRLAYVAITRAKKMLILTWCGKRTFRNKIKTNNNPSIFIKELYNKYVNFLNFNLKNNFNINKILTSNNNKHKIVIHNIFGKGFIEKIIFVDKIKLLLIKFDNFGLKTVLANYNKLQFID